MKNEKIENIHEENSKEITISIDGLREQKVPEFVQDISLIKLFLTPLEFFTFKYFLFHSRPITIREVYLETLQILFYNHIWVRSGREKLPFSPVWESLFRSLRNSNYYSESFITEKTANKIMDDLGNSHREKMNEGNGIILDTSIANFYYAQLQKAKIKFPSYIKFKKIFENFKSRGVIVQIKRENKAILFTLEPKTYTYLKDKKEDIMKL